MLQNFRCKNAKDIETAEESLILNTSFKPKLPDVIKTTPKITVTFQRENDVLLDDLWDKKK